MSEPCELAKDTVRRLRRSRNRLGIHGVVEHDEQIIQEALDTVVTKQQIQDACRRLPTSQDCCVCGRSKSVFYELDEGVCIICRVKARASEENDELHTEVRVLHEELKKERANSERQLRVIKQLRMRLENNK